MTHRRPDPSQAGLEEALRRALHAAVESVEPAANGLDRIRTKIAVRSISRSFDFAMGDLPPKVTRRRARPLIARMTPAFRLLGTRLAPLRTAAMGGFGWMRPAAAVVTGMVVVAVASWVIVALPQAVRPTSNAAGLGHTPQQNQASGPGSPKRGTQSHGSASAGPSATPTPTQSCTPPAAGPRKSRKPSPNPSPSGSASPSPSPSATPSPSASPSPSVSPSASPSASPSVGAPSPSPTASAPASAPPSAPPSAPASVAPTSAHHSRRAHHKSVKLTSSTAASLLALGSHVPVPQAGLAAQPCGSS